MNNQPTDPDFGRDMRFYILELENQSIVSRSHATLATLYRKYGKNYVERWLDDYFSGKLDPK